MNKGICLRCEKPSPTTKCDSCKKWQAQRVYYMKKKREGKHIPKKLRDYYQVDKKTYTQLEREITTLRKYIAELERELEKS